MGYRLGIDLGATIAVAALADDSGAVRAIPLGREAAVPSAVLVDTNGAIRCGEEASAAGATAPDRLVRRYVPRIGDEVPITVGAATGRHVQLHPQDITAAVVAWAVAKSTANERAVPDAVVLVHPAGWGAHKLELMQRALAARGLGHVRLISSAVAAGYAWIRINSATPGEAFAVFDVGGESVAASVLRVGEDGQAWPLGIPAARQDLGGVDFDDAVLRHVLDALDPAVRQALLEAAPDGTSLDALRVACRAAKETLSAATDATVEVTHDGRKILTRITRAEFEAAVVDVARRCVDVLLDAVVGAGLRVGDLSGVLLCGGSSAVPLIAQQLTTRMGPTVRLVREIHPAFTAAAGAALLVGPPPVVAPEQQPAQATVPQRPQLDVPTVIGRKPAAVATPTTEDDGPGRWGTIRIAPMRKASEPTGPSAKEIAREQAAAAKADARERADADHRAAVAAAESKQRAEAQRIAQAQAQQAKAAAEQAEAARRQAIEEATKARRLAVQQARLAAQRAEAERASAERAEVEHSRLSAEIARLTEENARLAARSAAAEQTAAELAAAQRAAIRKAAALKAARRAAAEKARLAEETAVAEQAAADQAAAIQAADEQAAADRSAAEREQAALVEPAAPAAPAAPIRLPEAAGRPARPSRRRHQVPVVAEPVSARSVVAPRDLGSLEDLLGAPAPRRLPATTAAEAQPASESTLEIVTGTEVEELYELTEGEFWIDEHGQIVDVLGNVYEYVEDDIPAQHQDLWHRGLAMCTSRRVLAVTAITVALMVGSGGWRALDSGVAGTQSTDTTSSTSAQSGDSPSTAAKSAKSTHTTRRAEPARADALSGLTP